MDFLYILEGAIYILCLIAEIVGMYLMAKALEYRTDKCPSFFIFHPKRILEIREWYTGPGYRYHWIGSSLVVGAGAICWITAFVIFGH